MIDFFNFSMRRSAGVLLVYLFFLAGCASFSAPVRHLSSDACLVLPEKTTKQEVVSFLGQPDRKIYTGNNNLETWLYLKSNKSFGRKLPLFGGMLGSQSYETVTVTFEAERVRACVYREHDENEFEEFITELELTVCRMTI